MEPFTPMRLTSLREPFDHRDWIFELKYDGFRSLAYIERSGTKLVSRYGNVYRRFGELEAAISAELRGRSAVLDGELVCLDDSGRPQFYDLLRRSGPVVFVAFDLIERDGTDLRRTPLISRKAILHRLVPQSCASVIVPGQIEGRGVDLFREVCRRDLEGIVAKWKYGAYVCGEDQPLDRRVTLHAHSPTRASQLTWLKVKNPAYSQMLRRDELFTPRARRMGIKSARSALNIKNPHAEKTDVQYKG